MSSMLRSLLLAGVSSVAFVSGASAADMAVKSGPWMAPASSWQGFYVGISGGAAQHTATWNQIDTGGGCITDGCSGTFNLFKNGGILGVHAGFETRSGSLMYGIEGDISWIDADVTQDWRPGRNHRAIQSSTLGDSLATVRGRAGLVVDGTTAYVTGGIAFARLTDSISMTAPTVVISTSTNVAGTGNSSRAWGWTVGGGIERSMGPNWSARAEALYVNLGTQTVAGEWRGPKTEQFTDTLVVGRLGVSYKFY